MACKLAGDGSPRPRVDAGQILRVVCEVRNDGPRARGVKVTARLGDNPPVAAAPFDLDSEKSTSVSLALQVPKAAVLDSELTLNVHASAGGGSGAEVDVTLALLVSRPKICPEGKLSRDKFNTKRIALRKKLDEGLISQEEHDKYYAELVECLE
jgi:hypothetical protein